MLYRCAESRPPLYLILITSEQIAHIIAGATVAPFRDKPVHPLLQRLGQGNVHLGH